MKEIIAKKYKLIEKIATGGMGTVYKAVHIGLKMPVAIKVLLPQYAESDPFIKRFYREARAMGQLSHPNIIKIHDLANDGELHFMAMELVTGKDLRDELVERGHFSCKKTIEISIQIASALDCAHNNGVIHRDIKPGNLILNLENIVKIGDFGLAQAVDEASITHTGQILGTPEYMSPLQARGETPTPAMDLYSLGIVMYKMLTGSTPFEGQSKILIVGNLISGSTDFQFDYHDNIPQSLKEVICRLVDTDGYESFNEAKDLEKALQNILYSERDILEKADAEVAGNSKVENNDLEEETQLFTSVHQLKDSLPDVGASINGSPEGSDEDSDFEEETQFFDANMSSNCSINNQTSDSNIKSTPNGNNNLDDEGEEEETQFFDSTSNITELDRPDNNETDENETEFFDSSTNFKQEAEQVTPKKQAAPNKATVTKPKQVENKPVEKEKKNNTIIIGSIAAVIFLVIIAGGGWYLKTGSLISDYNIATEETKNKQKTVADLKSSNNQENITSIEAKDFTGNAELLLRNAEDLYSKKDYFQAITLVKNAGNEYDLARKAWEDAKKEYFANITSIKDEVTALLLSTDQLREDSIKTGAEEHAATTWNEAEILYEQGKKKLVEKRYADSTQNFNNASLLYNKAVLESAENAVIKEKNLTQELKEKDETLKRLKAEQKAETKRAREADDRRKKEADARRRKAVTAKKTKPTKKAKSITAKKEPAHRSTLLKKDIFINKAVEKFQTLKDNFELKNLDAIERSSTMSKRTVKITSTIFKNYNKIVVKLDQMEIVNRSDYMEASVIFLIDSLEDTYGNKAIPSNAWKKFSLKLRYDKHGWKKIEW